MRSLVLTIDVEPVQRVLAPGVHPSWDGLDRCVDALAQLRSELQSRSGVAPQFSWFPRVDPQIALACGDAAAVLRDRRPLFAALEAAGDEIGIHVHAYRWLDEGGWVIDHGNAAWVSHCVESGIDAFRGAMNRVPPVFRFGDRFVSEAVLDQIEDLGVQYDLTIEAGAKGFDGSPAGERATGSLPDTWRAPRHPYRPCRSDLRLDGERTGTPRRLWEVPVTMGCVGAGLRRWLRRRHYMMHLNLALDPEWNRRILDQSLPHDPVMVSVLRTGDIASGAGVERFMRNLDLLLRRAADRRFVTPAGAVEEYARPAAERYAGQTSEAPVRGH